MKRKIDVLIYVCDTLDVEKMNNKMQFLVLCAVYFLICETETIIHKYHYNKNSKKCSKCPPGWGTFKRCTKDSDTHCVKCKQGRTYSPHYSSKSPCWLCSQCGVGLYESHRCSPVEDTICSECISYLDHKNLSISNDFSEKCAYLFVN